MEFNKIILKKVKTADGSVTFHNSEYDSAYHSLTGAEEEAIKKYAEQSGLAELAKKEQVIRILDVCFGVGYNSAACIDLIRSIDPKCSVNVMAIDNDIEIIKKIQSIDTKFNSYKYIKKLTEKNRWVKEDNVQIILFINDAKKVLKEMASEQNKYTKFHAVLFDPFSPKKQPEMWTEDFFSDIKTLMHRRGILVTYSCARSVRDNLKKAGFKVKDGQCVGRRGPSTIAIA